MKIQEMFRRDIGREIQGVIVAGQDADASAAQELEEYVVTRELRKHFSDFFSAYRKSIDGATPKMGVWISGFFGSGKSLLLKVFSYLLENRSVGGKRALDFFIDGDKIADRKILADMELAANTPADVILFNIDAKSESNGKKSRDAIVNVFLKVFNEMRGFSGAIPQLADLEHRLSRAGRYQEFRDAFRENYGDEWEASRQDFDFIQDTVVETLAEIGFMSEAAARNWCEKASEPYQISIEDFAKRVRDYIESKGGGHHVVFLVDEIGQYIGDDSGLMLNLQTVTEELGRECKGKAWVIVTSQQDIDSITKVKGNDFSKIQGRFDTRLSLSSANADAVIRKRILEKTDAAAQTLRLFYHQQVTVIKNLIVFNDNVEKKLYADADDFSEAYPFIPYQFHLLAGALTAIRKHGASGKHLSEGERSMLALFKESAMRLGDAETGAVVPFHFFYDALENFLDHNHKGVILRAYENGSVNPEGKNSDVFAIDVLKTLFMIKYVPEIRATLENITSLMISSLSDDRITLRDRVSDALRVLIGQALVQKNGDLYIFLTDEEQEINREIDAQNVEMSEVIVKASELIFDGILSEKRYRYPEFNGRYSFPYNQTVDDRPYRVNQAYDIGVRIVTPWYDGSAEDSVLRIMSGEGQEVVVALPNDDAFLSELSAYLKIENFLRLNTSARLAKYETIRDAKRKEMRERFDNAKTYLKDNLRDATIYVNGDILRVGAKEPASRVNEALGVLVRTVYHKLSYIDTITGEADIRKLFQPDGQTALDMGAPPNRYALEDMLSFVAGNSKLHLKTSMKTLRERFTRAPYGFVDDDVNWLTAFLFRRGDFDFSVSGAAVSRLDRTPDEIIGFITKKQYAERLMLEEHIRVSEKDKRAAREILRELFHVVGVSDDEEIIMRKFQDNCNAMITEMERLEAGYQRYAYPGKKVIASGKTLLKSVCGIASRMEFYKTVAAKRDDFLDLAEDCEPVQAFFKGEQRVIFERVLDNLAIYEDSKTYIVDQTLEDAVAAMRAIVRMESPYPEIHKLPELRQKFMDAYMKILQAEQAPVLDAIAQNRARIFDALSGKKCPDSKRADYVRRFDELKDGAKSCNNISTLRGFADKSDALKLRLLNEIDALPDENDDDTPTPPVIVKRVSIKRLTKAASWRVKSEADIERYLVALKNALLTELQDSDMIDVEF